MRPRAPGFWGAPAGFVARALAPAAALYGAAASARLARPAPRADLPTIAIGGPTLGGDGKTPTAMALAAILLARGERPAILSRGHGRAGGRTAPFAVDPHRHRARDVGDEALLLAGIAPTIIGVDRAAGARLARSLGASLVLLDDGLHSRRLDPDLALLVVDACFGAGNGFCPPAGPLRAPLAAQLARADAVVLIGGESAFWGACEKPVLRARLEPDPQAAERLGGARVFAFAGIGRPSKFAATLTEIGADLAGARWFPDHHAYSASDLAALAREADRLGAALVTTAKDAARIGRDNAFLARVSVIPVSLAFELPGAIDTLLTEFLKRARLRGALAGELL